MKSFHCLAILFSILPSTVCAQTHNAANAPINHPATLPSSDNSDNIPLLERALAATPPQRPNYAAQIFNSPKIRRDFDNWVNNLPENHPQIPTAKDLLLNMPIQWAGPRLVTLAKKSTDPALQPTWSRWFEKYPQPHADVLVHWMRKNADNPQRFLAYLQQYAALRPKDAINIWAQIVLKYPQKQLQTLASFGYPMPGCARAILNNFPTTNDELPQLRALLALSRCADAALYTPSNDEISAIATAAQSFLQNNAPSRKIVALQIAQTPLIPQQTAMQWADNAYSGEKNSTVRAFALRALCSRHAPNRGKTLESALKTGDETMRFNAASLIPSCFPDISADTLSRAFNEEIWPDTQTALYHAIAASPGNAQTLQNFQKNIVLDESKNPGLRMAALRDLSKTAPNALKIADMNALQTQSTPIPELIAATASTLYENAPEKRQTLRAWLKAQLPFDRPFLATFTRFLQTDKSSQTPAATASAVCNAPRLQDATVKICADYLENHIPNPPADLLDNLKKQADQIDEFSNFEF